MPIEMLPDPIMYWDAHRAAPITYWDAHRDSPIANWGAHGGGPPLPIAGLSSSGSVIVKGGGEGGP